MEMPSPVLVFGDPYISKNTINAAKKKYKDAHWEVVSASEQDPDEIRMISGFSSFGVTDKVILIQDIPNKKDIREFLIDLVKSSSENLKFVLWDSGNFIKRDPKTKELNKTWGGFVSELVDIPGSKVIDSGSDFTEKENFDCTNFVRESFGKFNKKIGNNAISIFVDIVGGNKGMILSEVQKLSLCCGEEVTPEFILKNAFPTSSEAVLYKFGNSLDSGNFMSAVNSFEEFIFHGANIYVLSEILVKRARWQLAVAQMHKNGIHWFDIPNFLMEMGKFPSSVWHDVGLTSAQKKNSSEDFAEFSDKIEFMTKKLGIPDFYFISEVKEVKEKKSKKEESDDDEGKKKVKSGTSGECLPLIFIAQQIVNSVKSGIFESNKCKYNEEILKDKVLTKFLLNYISVLDLMKEIRFNQDNAKSFIYEMMRILADFDLDFVGEGLTD